MSLGNGVSVDQHHFRRAIRSRGEQSARRCRDRGMPIHYRSSSEAGLWPVQAVVWRSSRHPARVSEIVECLMSAPLVRRRRPHCPMDRLPAKIEQTTAVGTRTASALSTLRRSNDIDDTHIAAADRWYRDWVMGVVGACDPSIQRSGQAADPHSRMLARIAASSRCTAVREYLGMQAERRLRMILVEELSFSEIGRRLLPRDVNSRKKIAAQTILLLEMLAEHYQNRDQCRRARETASVRSSNIQIDAGSRHG